MMSENKSAEQLNMEDRINRYLAYTNDPVKGAGIMNMMQPNFVECDYEERTLILSYQIQPWQLNTQSVMHGGILTSAIDNCCVLMTHYYAGRSLITTIDMETRFLKPVFLTDTLYVEARAVSRGRKTVTYMCTAWTNDKKNPVAAASSTFMIIPEKETCVIID